MLQGICNESLCIRGSYGHERGEAHGLPGPPVSSTLLRIFGESKQQLWEATRKFKQKLYKTSEIQWMQGL